LCELAAAAGPDAAVVNDVPLLAENGLQGDYDALVVADCSEDTQLRCPVERRGISEPEARSRAAAQASR